MKRVIFLYLILTFVLCRQAAAQPVEYGLYIQTFPLQANQYTSMALDDGNPIQTAGEEMRLSFKLSARNENLFGCVFRIITDRGENIDLMYSVSENDKRYPMLVTGDEIRAIAQAVKGGEWTEVALTFNPKNGDITLSYGNSLVKAANHKIAGARSVRISFGYCPFEGYRLADVASVNLKDIRIDRGGKAIRLWKMELHHRDNCYDELQKKRATGHNSRWILDEYITWKPIYHQNFKETPSIAFDPTIGTFYMATDKKKLYAFHPNEAVTDTLLVKGGEYAANYPNQLIYIPQQRHLLSYNLDENLYAPFNSTSQCWENSQAPVKEHDYWNNSLTYFPANASLVSFGGYGHYHFNNELLISYPYAPGATQHRVHLKEIHPRYSAASAIVDSTLYIFGGRGCPSGKQELSPKNYYDLYAVNLFTLQATKVWEASAPEESMNFLPGENLIYDRERKCFYFLCTRQGGTLMRISTAQPDFETMSLPIHSPLDAQYLYTNLYYSPKQAKLYAAIQQTKVDGKTSVDLYEMDYPPVPVKSVEQSETDRTEKAGHDKYIYPPLVIALLATAVFFALHKRKRKQPADLPLETEKEAPQPAAPALEMTMRSDMPEYHNYDLSKGSVCFFGGFRVMDKKGNDITSSFTPTLKALLILLILYTGKDPKGIVGHKLIQLLWFDKSEESAKNNRNVYISKLRNALEQVGNVRIVNQNGFWNIQFEDGTICDYLKALRLYQENDRQNLEKLIELLLHGSMLPNTEIDWIDPFKNDFSNTTIDLLSRLLKQEELSDAFRLKIADTLFQHDYINEEALQIKCSILCRQGKKGLAKTVYDSFCKEYTASLGTEYPVALMDLITPR